MSPAAIEMKNTSLADSYLSLVDALSAIHQLSELDLEGIPESVLLQQSLSALVKHQDLENCSLFLLRDERLVCAAATQKPGLLQATSGDDRDRNDLEGVSFPLGEGIIGAAFTTGTIQHCSDCISDERFRVLRDAGLFPEAGSFISIPVKSGESVLGVLNVVHLIPGFFEYWHQHFLTLYGNCMGRFLHNHRLLHNLEEMITQRTVELEHALTESEDLRQRYQRLSTTDDLTGLHNRRYFFIEGEAMLARALRDKTAISLLLVDIDYFKRINDTWGHAIGDRVLRLIADALRASGPCRRHDRASRWRRVCVAAAEYRSGWRGSDGQKGSREDCVPGSWWQHGEYGHDGQYRNYIHAERLPGRSLGEAPGDLQAGGLRHVYLQGAGQEPPVILHAGHVPERHSILSPTAFAAGYLNSCPGNGQGSLGNSKFSR